MGGSLVSNVKSWYTSVVGKPKKTEKLDVATGLAWLQVFADKFQVDTGKWSVHRLDDAFQYQNLPSQTVAEKLADFLAARFRVQAHVYEPMGSGWQVMIMPR